MTAGDTGAKADSKNALEGSFEVPWANPSENG